MIESLWLAGTLANHRRGLIVQDAVGPATPAKATPDGYGLCLMFGSEFQDGAGEFQKQWLDWSQVSGRTLLLIPPLTVRNCSAPVQWEVIHRTGVQSKDSLKLLKALAPEVRYELRGKLRTATHLGGAWADYAVNTAYYRKHPHSGVFAVTCLPLWSLTVLDRTEELKDWLSELRLMGGSPTEAVQEEEESLKLTKGHYAVLLHLLNNEFADRQEATKALEVSTMFTLDADEAKRFMSEMEKHGLIKGAAITTGGRELLLQSPYAPFAIELETMKHAV
jgi:hypothetical protein